jgi:hypothetical protein
MMRRMKRWATGILYALKGQTPCPKCDVRMDRGRDISVCNRCRIAIQHER